jgi:hypothetical protein
VTGGARYRVLLALIVAATFLTGLAEVVLPVGSPTTSSTAVATVAEARRAAVEDLLARRGKAVLSRDEAGFLATVDPAADQAFRDAQRALFHNLAAVPLHEWSYRLDPRSTLDVGAIFPADELWAPGVRLSYGLDGTDPRPTDRPMAYLFARHGDRWFLASDTALEPMGKRTWRGPWDFGPCRVLSSSAGLVLSHPGGEALAARVLAELDSAVGAVTSVWGAGWAQRVAVWIPSDAREMEALVGPAFAVGSVAGVAVADEVDRDNHTAAGQRVVLNPQIAASSPPLSLRIVLRHEITHVAARGATVDGAPMWLLEGFADYVGYRGNYERIDHAAPALAAQVRAGSPLVLPDDGDFRADGSRMDLAYQQAWTVNVYLAQRFGENRLVQLYRALAGGGRPDESEVDAVLRQVIGAGKADLVSGWQDFLRTSVAGWVR